jgi:hypothetical protein
MRMTGLGSTEPTVVLKQRFLLPLSPPVFIPKDLKAEGLPATDSATFSAGSIIAVFNAFSVLSRKDIPMKVSLYVREHSTRKYRKAKSTEPAGTVYVLRYGGTWETLDAANWNDARVAQLRKEAALLEGWRPKVEKRKPAGLMLDAAMDAYLSEILASRKKKTHQAYSVALRYFYECMGNKPIKNITRSDLVNFSVFLREDKGQSPDLPPYSAPS